MFSSRIKIFSASWVSQLAVRFASRGERCAGRTGRHGLPQAGGCHAAGRLLLSHFHLCSRPPLQGGGNRKMGRPVGPPASARPVRGQGAGDLWRNRAVTAANERWAADVLPRHTVSGAPLFPVEAGVPHRASCQPSRAVSRWPRHKRRARPRSREHLYVCWMPNEHCLPYWPGC